MILILLLTVFPNTSFAATQCLGHKGDLEHGFENSMEAFSAAYENGADGVELDIYHTKDRVAVVAHDQTLKNLANSKPGKSCPLGVKFRKLSYAEIRDNCILKNGEEIPTLEDVFKKFSDKKFTLLVEFEDFPKKTTFQLIRRYYGGHPERIKLVGVKPVFTIFRIKMKRLFSRYWREIGAYTTNHKFIPLTAMIYDGVDVSTIRDDQITDLIDDGKAVSMWTYSDEESIRHYMKLGVQYLTTDSVSTCVRVRDRMDPQEWRTR